jgi:hypothetical protein
VTELVVDRKRCNEKRRRYEHKRNNPPGRPSLIQFDFEASGCPKQHWPWCL